MTVDKETGELLIKLVAHARAVRHAQSGEKHAEALQRMFEAMDALDKHLIANLTAGGAHADVV